MNTNQEFNSKWEKINNQERVYENEEKSLFVETGEKPTTQRQLNLYYYFLFIKEFLERNNVQDVVEVGCGRGTMALYLAKYLKKNLTLLDSSWEAIEIAKKEFQKYNVSMKSHVADVLESNLSSGQFDAVVSIGLAEHFSDADVKKLFAEQFRVLRKGGVMISLNIPKKISIQYINSAINRFRKIFKKQKRKITKDYFRNSLKPDDYLNIAKEVGFEDLSYVNVCPFPIYTPISMNLDKRITKINKIIIKFRKLFYQYPYRAGRITSQGHFLVGYKK